MAWSYDPAKLEDALNWVRARIGDTDTNDQQLSDEEITSLLARYVEREAAAREAAFLIAAKYARFGALNEEQTYLTLAAEIGRAYAGSYL